jgi:hypothetical protein
VPRKKTQQDEPISVLRPDIESIDEPTEKPVNQTVDEPVEAESCSHDYLTASLQAATQSIGQLFEKQCEIAGVQAADAAFDSFESAFVNHLQARLKPFVNTLLPEIRESHTQLKERTIARAERRISGFDRIKQIATLISDECRLSLPSNEPTGNLLGFATWDVNNDGGNDHE